MERAPPETGAGARRGRQAGRGWVGVSSRVLQGRENLRAARDDGEGAAAS